MWIARLSRRARQSCEVLVAATMLLAGCVSTEDLPERRVSFAIPSHAPLRGPESARISLVEFGDFECIFCGELEPTLRQVLVTYPEDVALSFVNAPLRTHPRAMPAAQAFMAASLQGQAWEMHDLMYANQSALSDLDLDGYASELGLNVDQFDWDRHGDEVAAEIAEDEALSDTLDLEGTPTCFINGRELVGARPFSDFKRVIDQELTAK